VNSYIYTELKVSLVCFVCPSIPHIDAASNIHIIAAASSKDICRCNETEIKGNTAVLTAFPTGTGKLQWKFK